MYPLHIFAAGTKKGVKNMTIFERLKAARKKAGLTQVEVSERMGISKHSYTQWELGYRNPTIKTLKKIASALDIPFESLILDDDEKSAEMSNTPEIFVPGGTVTQREAQFEQDMNELRKIQKERDKIMLDADKAALAAIQASLEMMKALQEEEEEKGVTAMGMADLGRAIAAMRESMNKTYYPAGYYGDV